MNTEEENEIYLKDCIDRLDELATTADEARLKGDFVFIHSKPCRNGHLPVRLTSTNRCAVCTRRGKRRYFNENKEKAYKSMVRRQKERYRSDPKFRASAILRDCIKRVFKSIEEGKSSNTFSLLGYSCEDFMSNIESKFSEGMDWDNHGVVWQLDHIIPMGAFDLADEHQRVYCNSLENLQPLFVSDHEAKTRKDVALIALLKSGKMHAAWKDILGENKFCFTERK